MPFLQFNIFFDILFLIVFVPIFLYTVNKEKLLEMINVDKLKVYLDTSVISHLLQNDVPEKMADTRQLWKMFCSGKYDVYLSTVTLEDLKN